MYKCMVIRRVIHVHCVHCSIPVDLRYSTIISYNSYCIWSMKEHIPCYTVELLTGQGVAVFGQQMTKHTLPCVFIWHPHIHTFNKPPVSGKKKLYIKPILMSLKARNIRIQICFASFSKWDFEVHLRTALSNSWGRLVAPIINTLSSPLPAIPDTYMCINKKHGNFFPFQFMPYQYSKTQRSDFYSPRLYYMLLIWWINELRL